MGLFDFFRRSPPLRDAVELADFIDQRAAFLTQKGIYEYSRARSGHYAKVLFREPEFQAASNASRWRIYPMGLAMVGELAEGTLYPAARDERMRQVEAIGALTLAVFDRYPVPPSLGAELWKELRSELDHRLRLIGLHPPKLAKDIPEPYWESYVDLMPIHEKLRRADAPTIRNYLRVTMINIHDQLTKRLDAPAVAASLRGHWNLPPLTTVGDPVAAN